MKLDLTNKRFGRLVVLECVYIKNKHGKNIKQWKCLCDCGKEKITTANCLNFKRIQSCGCLYKDSRKDVAERTRKRNSKEPEIASFNRLYSDYKYRAKVKNIKFSLSIDEFKIITKNDCFYCGEKPLQTGNKIASKNGAYLHNGVDRLDNNIGYTVENCVACCSMCNNAKSSYSLQEFTEWINRLIKYRIGFS